MKPQFHGKYLFHPYLLFRQKYAEMIKELKPQQKVVRRFILDNQYYERIK